MAPHRSCPRPQRPAARGRSLSSSLTARSSSSFGAASSTTTISFTRVLVTWVAVQLMGACMFRGDGGRGCLAPHAAFSAGMPPVPATQHGAVLWLLHAHTHAHPHAPTSSAPGQTL